MRLSKIFFWIGIGFFFFFLLIMPFVQEFLRLPMRGPYMMFSVSALLIFLVSIWRGVLPGLQRFFDLTVNTNFESFLKLLLAFLFIVLAWGLTGAIGAMVLASFFAFLFLLWQLRELWKGEREPVPLPRIVRFFFVVFFWTLALTVLVSLDIILVKRFFSAEVTGLYAAMSLLGKIIFFASTSIAGVLFPMSTELFESGNHAEHRRLMWRALGLTSIIALSGVLVYWLFPTLVVTILFGRRYLPFAPLLVFFGIAALFLSMSQLLATYFLSIKHRWFLLLLFAAFIIEGTLVWFFHNDIRQIVNILMFVFGGLALFLFLAFLFSKNGEKTTAILSE